VEASLPKKADNVIDISWAVPDGAGQAPKTDLRTRDRQSYATAHIDGVIADGNLASYMDNMPLKSAQCCKSDQLSLFNYNITCGLC